MNKIILILIGCFVSLSGCTQNKIFQTTFDDQWKFKVGDDKTWAQPNFIDTDWDKVSSLKALEEQKGFENFDGFGWYRKQIIIPGSAKAAIQSGGGILISFQQVDDCDALYFNGQYIGRTGNFPPSYESKYNTPREYKVPAEYIAYNTPNTLALRVYDGGGGGGLISKNIAVRSMTPFDRVVMQVDVNDKDKIFLDTQSMVVNVQLKNDNKSAIKATLHVDVTTDDFKPVQSKTYPFQLKPNQNFTTSITVNATPGFYRYSIYLSDKGEKGKPAKFNMGYEPEQIKGVEDAKNDFYAFWQNNLKELAQVAPDYQLTPKPQYSNNDYEVFEVSMNSFGGERVKGYYAKPKREGKFPVSIEYQGYSTGPHPPNVSWDGFAHMIMSIRGQGYNMPENKYGDWIIHGLQSKEDYYYRGAFLDAVRGIDFVCTRPEIDTTKIVAMGGSQGGALTFAAAALDHRIKATAPTVPFLSDYKNYFKIVSWPRSSFENYRKKHPDVSWDHIYDVISYFDIKNLAPWIKSPMLMGIGMQDEVCPPHINFAAYNNVPAPKQWIAYADEGHNVGSDFYEKRLAFFKKQLGID
jgi:cephalosporin-C deacetylase-like acetyl esterase